MVSRSELISLGSISKLSEHGPLLDEFKSMYLKLPGKQRKAEVLDRLEIAQVLDMLGLRGAVKAAHTANERLLTNNRDEAITRMKAMLMLELQAGDSLLSLLRTSVSGLEPQIDGEQLQDDADVGLEIDSEPEPVVTADDMIVESEPMVGIQEHGQPAKAVATDLGKSFALAGLMTSS